VLHMVQPDKPRHSDIYTPRLAQVNEKVPPMLAMALAPLDLDFSPISFAFPGVALTRCAVKVGRHSRIQIGGIR
jgi:hypothetical protein